MDQSTTAIRALRAATTIRAELTDLQPEQHPGRPGGRCYVMGSGGGHDLRYIAADDLNAVLAAAEQTDTPVPIGEPPDQVRAAQQTTEQLAAACRVAVDVVYVAALSPGTGGRTRPLLDAYELLRNVHGIAERAWYLTHAELPDGDR